MLIEINFQFQQTKKPLKLKIIFCFDLFWQNLLFAHQIGLISAE